MACSGNTQWCFPRSPEMNWPGLNFALLPVTLRKQTHFSGLVQNNSLQCGADTEHQYVWRSSCLEWYRWYPAWTPTKKRKKKTWFLLFTSQTQNERPLWDPLHSLALWSQTGLIKAALLCFSTLFCDFCLWNQTGHTSGHLELNKYDIHRFACTSVNKQGGHCSVISRACWGQAPRHL